MKRIRGVRSAWAAACRRVLVANMMAVFSVGDVDTDMDIGICLYVLGVVFPPLPLSLSLLSVTEVRNCPGCARSLTRRGGEGVGSWLYSAVLSELPIEELWGSCSRSSLSGRSRQRERVEGEWVVMVDYFGGGGWWWWMRMRE